MGWSRRDDRVRVARVITRLNVGGPAIQAMLLTDRLDPDRFDPVLIAGRPGEVGEVELLEPRVEAEKGVSRVDLRALAGQVFRRVLLLCF